MGNPVLEDFVGEVWRKNIREQGQEGGMNLSEASEGDPRLGAKPSDGGGSEFLEVSFGRCAEKASELRPQTGRQARRRV